MADQDPIKDDFRLAFSIDNFCRYVCVGRTTAYAEIKAGRLQTIKCGRRTLIRRKDAETWLEQLADEQVEAGK